jgi:hypothetical protein
MLLSYDTGDLVISILTAGVRKEFRSAVLVVYLALEGKGKRLSSEESGNRDNDIQLDHFGGMRW